MGPSNGAGVLMVTRNYWPELVGSGPYCADLAEWLVASGSVGVLTCRPHYPHKAAFPDYHCGGRDHEIRNGVAIERLASRMTRRDGAAARIVSEALFLAEGVLAMATGRVRRQPLVVSLCPSILAVLLGGLATARNGIHVTLVHDIQSGLAAGLGMVRNRRLVRLMQWVERRALNRADLVLVLTRAMAAHLRAIGVTAPVEVLPIWIDPETVHPMKRPAGQPFTLLYSGNFGRKQGLGQVIDLAEELRNRQCGVRIVLRGSGREWDRVGYEVMRRGLDHVEFRSLVPRERFNESLAEGDIHLVPQDNDTASYAMPSKVYGIMASGRPFVATAQPGTLLWQLQEESGAFLCVPTGDTGAFADAVMRLVADEGLRRTLGARGRQYVVEHHAKEAVFARFAAMVDSRREARWRKTPAIS